MSDKGCYKDERGVDMHDLVCRSLTTSDDEPVLVDITIDVSVYDSYDLLYKNGKLSVIKLRGSKGEE